MAPDTGRELDAEGRCLLASLKECNAKQMEAVDQLSHPRTMMTYPVYIKAADALTVMRFKCRQNTAEITGAS